MKHTDKCMHEVFGGHSQHDSLTTAQLQHTWHRLAQTGTCWHTLQGSLFVPPKQRSSD